MIGRYPLCQGQITEHRRLLLIVSTHNDWINQILEKCCDPHQAMSFSAACEARTLDLQNHAGLYKLRKTLPRPSNLSLCCPAGQTFTFPKSVTRPGLKLAELS